MKSKPRLYHPTERKIKKWFKKLNTLFFNDTLPEFNKINIKSDKYHWGLCKGECKKEKILNLELSKSFPSFCFFISILAHEMIHAYQYMTIGKMSHSESFERWNDVFLEYGLEIKDYDELE